MDSLSHGRPLARRLRVALCPSDTPYDYEMAKLPHDVFLLGNTHRIWNAARRPLPDQLHVSYSLDSIRADVLILGVDQWSFDHIEKRVLFLRLRDRFSGPKIVINHGCNKVDGCTSEAMRTLVQDNLMVCSSETAKNLWNVARSFVIRRGLRLVQWPETNYSRGNVVAFEPRQHPYFYNAAAIQGLMDCLRINVDRLGRHRTFSSFDTYRTFLASSAIYFNPSYAAPNPQAMVEAQLCGLAVVTTNAHGESDYIENGENGFASNDMDELYTFVDFLLRNPKSTRRIGANGRRTAQRLFNSERFIAQWNRLLVGTVAGAPVDES